MAAELSELKEKELVLMGRLNQDSGNSHRPPSSDIGRRHNNARTRCGRKPGGQPGHKGSTLTQASKPDETIVLRPACCACGHCFDAAALPAAVERRQVFDIPPPKLLVTEYQAATLACPRCGAQSAGAFPEGVDAPVQYGPAVKAVAVNLVVYNYIPSARTVELLRDAFGVSLSPGSLAS